MLLYNTDLMDVIKLEPGVDPLTAQTSDNTNLEEEPLSEEANLPNLHSIQIKSECDDSYDFIPEVKLEETPGKCAAEANAIEEHPDQNTEDEPTSNDASTIDKETFRSQPRKKTKLTDESCTKEAFSCMKTLTEIVSKRDDYSVYGEHIANRLRNSGRSKFEIAIAQHEIDNICFKLTVGGFSQQNAINFST
ncbi:uncharacterized protein [Periplaneta americana]|uniref:uncharacterized protein isoform X2 n=1 Tax=Periplaneta americana TaxID=6978 RepID=UPI0037E87C47